mmetsp:Transcript_43847/g.136506  ORF Transcript_43847/g.136506 Transcript_43847/m.136506 type:complete len:261 (+) Transcript_43847:193-975(+)
MGREGAAQLPLRHLRERADGEGEALPVGGHDLAHVVHALVHHRQELWRRLRREALDHGHDLREHGLHRLEHGGGLRGHEGGDRAHVAVQGRKPLAEGGLVADDGHRRRVQHCEDEALDLTPRHALHHLEHGLRHVAQQAACWQHPGEPPRAHSEVRGHLRKPQVLAREVVGQGAQGLGLAGCVLRCGRKVLDRTGQVRRVGEETDGHVAHALVHGVRDGLVLEEREEVHADAHHLLHGEVPHGARHLEWELLGHRVQRRR